MTLYAILIGFGLDLLIGDPQGFPHPVIWIGKLISFLERQVRKLFPKTDGGEKAAGVVLWFIVVIVSTLTPLLILWGVHQISPWFRLLLESIMCWQILAVKSLRVESMKVCSALESSGIEEARHAVSMILGRDTESLDATAVTKATVETVAENTADGVVAPLLFMAVGGAPLGFFYKAVNTMDSMLGYIEAPYKDIGFFAAKMDDVMNYIPARISALLMLAAGRMLKLDLKNGWKIFRRDRYAHASPNSGQTESVCAGLLGVQLAGDAFYHNELHKKPYIGDPLREVEYKDISCSCSLMTVTAFLALGLAVVIRLSAMFSI